MRLGQVIIRGELKHQRHCEHHDQAHHPHELKQDLEVRVDTIAEHQERILMDALVMLVSGQDKLLP